LKLNHYHRSQSPTSQGQEQKATGACERGENSNSNNNF